MHYNLYTFVAHTETVIQKCVECSRDYRTYVPGTVCHLPDDSGVVTYQEPQTKCPACDENGYGMFMNEDLFPELSLKLA